MNTTLARTATTAIADAAAALPRHDTTIRSTRITARTRRRTPLLLIIAAAIAAALPLMGGTPAQAATYRDPTPGVGKISTLAATGCRAAPFSFHFEGYGALMFPEDPAGMWNATRSPVLKTTSQCKDINVKNVGSKKTIRACVMFGTTSTKCNYLTDIPVGQWRNVATNVKDGTKFRLRIGVVLGGNPFNGNGANGYADF
jgi:hypothetical protein